MNVDHANHAPDLVGIAVRALMLYSLAEFQGGNATTIRVTAQGHSFGIADDGRGHSLDRSVEGIPYLKFIYSHFDHPFGSGRSAPVQLQGIGMSLINALCSELTLTVRKRDERLEQAFREGRLESSDRIAVASQETGITLSGKINPQLRCGEADVARLEGWLLEVLASSPSLRLFLNGRELKVSDRPELL